MDNLVEIIATLMEDVADIPADEITSESYIMDDLDLSSLEIMSVIAEVERKYSISISENELLKIKTVGELSELINDKIKG